MRFMLFVKSNPESEAGVLPTESMLEEMAKFNEEMIKAGIMLAGDGLKPSSQGVRIQYDGKQRTVVDGPFAEAKELVAGYWIIQVKSKDEAIAWMTRAPFQDGVVEIRPIYELEEFVPGEAIEHHRRLQQEIAKA